MKQPIANPFQRFVASLVDSFLFLTPMSFLLLRLSNASSITDLLNISLNSILLLILLSTVWGGLSAIFTHKLGGFIGKSLTGIAVVDADNNYLSLSRSFFRQYIAQSISCAFLGLGYIWIIIDRSSRRGWHDLICQDYVVVRRNTLSLALLVVLLGLVLNIFLFTRIINNFRASSELFHQTISDLATEIVPPSPTPTPSTHTHTYDHLSIQIPSYLTALQAPPSTSSSLVPLARFINTQSLSQKLSLLEVSVYPAATTKLTSQGLVPYSTAFHDSLLTEYAAVESIPSQPPQYTHISTHPTYLISYRAVSKSGAIEFIRTALVSTGREHYLFTALSTSNASSLLEFDKILSSATFNY